MELSIIQYKYGVVDNDFHTIVCSTDRNYLGILEFPGNPKYNIDTYFIIDNVSKLTESYPSTLISKIEIEL